MANHFVRALGLPIGRSLLEEDKVELAREILDYCKEAGKTIALPSDFVVAKSPDDAAGARTVAINKIPDDLMALDVGPKTLEQFARLLGPARTIFWNGPMGVFEKAPFDKGTRALAHPRCRFEGRDRRRRRRERPGRARGGRRRQVHARVDRRRSVARVSRGREAAGHRSAPLK